MLLTDILISGLASNDYLTVFYFLSNFFNPRSSFTDNYIVLLCLVYCVTGIAYALAIVLDPGPSQLCSAFLSVVLTLIATTTKDNKVYKLIANLCYPKWALEAFVAQNAERYYGVWIMTRCTVLILVGIASRVIALLGMLVFQRK
ncbi:unnamed protein product [Coffea canephora]|uniref:ABC transporter family G domain-containing protein n=1 Tax=Coffea canephora TaxID=49390 RepID=A0A068TU60_COFCA|nr:unnamed protein product [Coffea canephora]